MSATYHSVKSNFVGRLKNLFRKSDTNGSPAPTPGVNPPAPSVSAVASAKPASTTARATPNGSSSDNNIQIPLQSIIATLPLELRGRVVQKIDISDLTVPVPIEKTVPQLAGGMVKMTFGEIRQAVPHAFSASPNCDRVEVILPLAEILSRLNLALLVRRPAQKQVTVPMDIATPFGAQGEGLILSMGKAKTEPTASPQFAASHQTPVTPAKPVARAHSPFVPPPSALPDQVFKRAPARPTAAETPITPISPISPASPVKPVKPALPTSPTPVARPKDYLTSPPVPRAIRPASPTPATQPAPPIRPVSATQPAPAAQPAPTSTTEAPSLSVSLSALAEGWPDALRQEIVQSNLTDVRLALPTGQIEAALKQGRVVFRWKVLRSWIQPAQPPQISAHDTTELELPLSVLAPLFVSRKKEAAKPQQHVVVDEAIPNLFFGLPQPEPVATAPAPAGAPINKAADTNYYIWDDVSETARVDETEFKRRAPRGTEFVTRYATPNEVVSRAAALDGVAGVLIALPDGLMVANRIPPELNGDTLAAFLPQIYAKVSQTTKELRMGELNNLSFTVGNVPWKIFRVNAIFFAAFGRVGEALPTLPLAALAAELDRNNK